ncbi:ABC transporter ATP-binding protein [Tepidiphilus margaritifer]|uniref:ABC transporter ATP-binding protein n=1 Tax=Tepidiphilus margaritifer TaxID=203471 RepID=UPI0004053099|nr:ABC transporter ATP-binding protein [Tepidiphilus margaritifer]
MLELQRVSAHYGPIQALAEVDLVVRAGEIVTLIGANGAGKSTLMTTLFGTPRASSGRILLEGEDITALPPHRIARLGMALVPEGRRVFAKMSVYENLLLGATPLEGAHVEENLQRVFSLFPVLETRRTQRAGTLSGGEQQMLAIGRALMSEPRLLLLDEPSLGLAPLVIRTIFRTIVALNREHGLTILLVEQNARQALKIAHRGYVLQNGRIVLEGSGAALLADPQVRAAYLDAAS